MATQNVTASPLLPPALADWLNETLHRLKFAVGSSPVIEPLQTEASFRQFYRVRGAVNSLVLMNSPPDKELNTQFVALANTFATSGLQVPEILAHEENNGWLLLTDLGKTHFIDAYRAGEQDACLTAAIRVLELLAATDDPVIPAYTPQRLSDEIDIFVDWLVADACGLALPGTLLEPARRALLANAAAQPQVCVHRDFHCKNLLFNGPANAVGVLDFQDALVGPAGYDLASLLHDCYWNFDDEFIDAAVRQVPHTSRRDIDLLAVQRQLKAIGIFARLASRDGKTSHLKYIEPVLANLNTLCARYQELKSLGEWLHNTLTPKAVGWAAAGGNRTQ